MLVTTCRRLTIGVAAAAAVMATTAVPAMATGPAAACPAAPLSNPFTPWNDYNDYQLAPEGGVESGGTTWSTTGGAAAVEGNETSMVGKPTDHRSMRLPASSTAATARMCIGADHPTFRFFVKRTGGTVLSSLMVEIVFNDASGQERSVLSGFVTGSGSWAPSPSMPTRIELLGLFFGDTIDVSYRFRPVLGGVWSVDDVYVDPWRIH